VSAYFRFYSRGDGAHRDWLPYRWCAAFYFLTDHLPTIFHTASVWLTVALAAQRYVYAVDVAQRRKSTLHAWNRMSRSRLEPRVEHHAALRLRLPRARGATLVHHRELAASSRRHLRRGRALPALPLRLKAKFNFVWSAPVRSGPVGPV